MRSLRPARTRRPLRVVALCALLIGAVVTLATAAGPGGWDHLGDRGTPGSDSLDLVASALAATPGALFVGGEFTDAGGIPAADRIATWNSGASWSAVSSSTSQISNGRVSDIAVAAGKVYAGGTFQNAGGDADADFLAVWDGVSWKPFCDATGPAFGGNVTSLEIVGQTLYVGGSFQNGADIASADYLLACDLETGAPSSTVLDPAHPFAGPVYALTADSNGTLYAGGGFINLENHPAADNVAFRPSGGSWQPMGAGAGPCGCAVTTFVRGLTAVGTDVYVGTDANDVAGIPQADHVARWDGSAWSAVGADSGGANGWFPTTTSINALASTGSHLFVTGTFLNAGGDARADHVAVLRRHRMAPRRLRRSRQRPVVRHRARARARRSAALCGRELHERRWRPAGALRRLVRADADHRLPDPHGHPAPEPRPDTHRHPQPDAGARRA